MDTLGRLALLCIVEVKLIKSMTGRIHLETNRC